MNTTINLGNVASSFTLVAAALVLAYGVWVGRRDLGVRGALGVLGTTILTSLASWLLTTFLFLGPSGNPFGGIAGVLRSAVLMLVSTAIAFVPYYIAVNWLEVIRDAARPRA